MTVQIVVTTMPGTLSASTSILTNTILVGETTSAAFSITGLSGAVQLETSIILPASIVSFRGISITGSTLNLQFNSVPSFTSNVDDQEWTTDTDVNLPLPAATGGSGSISYSLSATTDDGTLMNGLPAGLSFDDSTRKLTGTPTTPGTYSLEYTASDSNGNLSLTFSGEVSAPPPVLASRALASTSVFALTGTAITPLTTPAVKPGTGSGSITYYLTTVGVGGTGVEVIDDLPNGLSFDPDTRILSGTPTAPGVYRLRYGALDSNRISVYDDFFFFISDALAFSSTQTDQTYSINRANSLQLPQATGGPSADRFSPLIYSLAATTTTGDLTDNLPAGMRFDASTRTLSGTPTTAGTYSMTYTVTDNNRNLAQSFDIVVTPALAFARAQADQIYSINRTISLELPQSTGGIPNRIHSLTATTSDGTLVNDLPDGLTFAAGTLSGTPTAPGTYRMTHTVTDDDDFEVTQDFDIVVTAALAFADTQADKTYSINRTISLELPQATGGVPVLTYRLAATTTDGTLVNDLPAGLMFAADTRTLSGTPTTPGTYRMTHTVADKDAVEMTQGFDIVVTAALAFSRTQDDQTGIEGRAITSLVLPQADGGVPTLTYSLVATTIDGTLVDDLPAGLDFQDSTRTLSGTPTAPGTYRMTHTVTDEDDVEVTQNFDFTVTAALAFAKAQPSQAYTTNQAIKPLILPQADGGVPTLTYSLAATTSLTAPLVNDLPTGLSFTPATRTLSGTPTAIGTYRMTHTVTDGDSVPLTQSFDIVVTDMLAFADTQADKTYSVNRTITLLLPQAGGGTSPLTYSLAATSTDGTLVSDLPAGLGFESATRTLSGMPTAPGTYRMTYTVTDSAATEVKVEQSFDIVVTAALAFADTQPDQIYSINRAISQLILPQANGGVPTLTYNLEATTSDDTLVNDLPAGLSFEPATRTLSGTPTAPGTYRMTHTVTDGDGVEVTQDFDIVVTDVLAFANTQTDQIYASGRTIGPLVLPQADGGIAPRTYSLEGTTSDGTLTGDNLPAGLVFATGTRTLSGTPTAPGTYRMTYTVTDAGRVSMTQSFDIVITQTLAFARAQANQTYTSRRTIALVLPQANGGTPALTYSLAATTADGTLVNDLPTGLMFVAGTRTLSGTPTAPGTYRMAYTVTDDDDVEVTQEFDIVITGALAFVSTQTSQTYSINRAITLVLPQASGGIPSLSYSLESTSADGSLFNALPTGLSFAADTRTLSGTPTAPGTYRTTYTVTDSDGVFLAQSFDIVITEALAFASPSIDGQAYVAGRPILDLVLPTASGGIAPLTYSLASTGADSTLPAGLIFDPNTRTLSGTPAVAGTYLLAFTVTDADGIALVRNFQIVVTEALAFVSTPTDQIYPIDQPVATLVLPEASGGSGGYTYSLSTTGGDGSIVNGLPAGLRFDPATRLLSGTPTARGSYPMTYGVTDADGYYTRRQFDLTVMGQMELAATLSGQIEQAAALLLIAETSQSIGNRLSQVFSPSAGQISIDPGASSLVLPLTGNYGGEVDIEQEQDTGSMALWLQANSQQLTSDSGMLTWDGDISTFQLGLDAQISTGLLLGLMVSESESSFDYRGFADAWQGTYRAEQSMVSPYLAWTNNNGFGLWASVGTGQSTVEVLDLDGLSRATGELGLTTTLFAMHGRLFAGRISDLNLKLEFSSAQIAGFEEDPAAAMQTEGRQLRLAIENNNRFQFKSGASFIPSLQLALRTSSDANQQGDGLEVGGSVRYQSAKSRLLLEIGGRSLQTDQRDYEESGGWLLFRLRLTPDKRGPTATLAPEWGVITSAAETLWDSASTPFDALSTHSADYGREKRMKAELAWGFSTGGRGLLTPYGKLGFSKADSRFTLGGRWEVGDHFSLSLEHSRQQAGNRASLPGDIRLFGQLRF